MVVIFFVYFFLVFQKTRFFLTLSYLLFSDSGHSIYITLTHSKPKNLKEAKQHPKNKIMSW